MCSTKRPNLENPQDQPLHRFWPIKPGNSLFINVSAGMARTEHLTAHRPRVARHNRRATESVFWGNLERSGQKPYCGEKLMLWGDSLALVSVDERGRLKIPKELGIRKARAVVIPAGSFFVVIPLPHEPPVMSQGWLRTKRSRVELRALAERAAAKDAIARARRRKQL